MTSSKTSAGHQGLQDCIVIGGGLGGLAAAESMLEGAADRITILEPSGRCGGVLDTMRRDGWLVERSADSFLSSRPEGVLLTERLGIAQDLVGVSREARRALVFHNGRTVPVPTAFRILAPGRFGPIMSSPLFSPLGKARMLCEALVPRRAATVRDESLEHFAVRRLGREAFERLVQPLAGGIWTADPSRLSMAAACPEFFAMELAAGSLTAGEHARLSSSGTTAEATGARYGQFVALAGGMASLIEALTARLTGRGVEIRRAAARRIRHDGNRWMVELDDGESLYSPGVVVATRSAEAARLLAAVDQPLADALSSIQYAGSVVLSLGYARADVEHPLDAAGVVIPRSAGRRIIAVSFSSSKYPGRAPAGHVLLRVFVGGALDPEAMLLDDGPLLDLVSREIGDLLGVRGAPRLVQIDRWADAMPQYHLGHLDRVTTIKDRLARLPGLAVAGAAYDGVGIPQVIASGQAAARAVLAWRQG